MPEAAQRSYAFDRCAAQAVRTDVAAPGVSVGPRRPASMWSVRGHSGDADFMRDVVAAFGVELPREANRGIGEETRALWLGPDEWLVVSSRTFADIAITNAALTDVSHGRAVVRVWGREARNALAKGCAIDLDPREFAVNACAQTAIAKINVVLDHVHPDVFDLYCPRSYAGSLWHWLTDATAEYGCNIVP